VIDNISTLRDEFDVACCGRLSVGERKYGDNDWLRCSMGELMGLVENDLDSIKNSVLPKGRQGELLVDIANRIMMIWGLTQNLEEKDASHGDTF